MDQSYIEVSQNGACYSGKDAVSLYRAKTAKMGLELYAKSKIKLTRGASPSVLLAIATEYTGNAYKRGQYLKAAEDLRVWIETMATALPIIQRDEVWQKTRVIS